jgi:hypothetical protein
MKNLLFLTFVICFLTFSLPAFALTPIDVGDTRHYYPTDSGQDQNYIPSDPNLIETIPLIKSAQIQQTFNPILSGTDADGNPVYQHQTINNIRQNIDTRELNTDFLRQDHDYFARPNFDPYTPESTTYFFSNSTRHSLPASVQKCLLSNQIVDISTFILGGNSVCIDREITTPDGPIRVGEIISALINAGDLLYYPDPKCPPNQTATQFPATVTDALATINYTYQLTVDQYRQLYLTGIEPVCANSLAQKIEHCDLNDKGEKLNCNFDIRSQPLGAVPAQDIYQNYRPVSAIGVSRDYNQTQNNPPAVDKPNPLSWLARYWKMFWDAVLAAAQTFSGPHIITTYVDSRQINTLKSFESSGLLLLPEKTIKTKNLRTQPSSGTNDITIDPGNANSVLTNTLYQNLTPVSWH